MLLLVQGAWAGSAPMPTRDWALHATSHRSASTPKILPDPRCHDCLRCHDHPMKRRPHHHPTPSVKKKHCWSCGWSGAPLPELPLPALGTRMTRRGLAVAHLALGLLGCARGLHFEKPRRPTRWAIWLRCPGGDWSLGIHDRPRRLRLDGHTPRWRTGQSRAGRICRRRRAAAKAARRTRALGRAGRAPS